MPGIPTEIFDEIASGARYSFGENNSDLSAWRTRFGPDIKPLIASLKANPDLTHLNLYQLNIGSDGLIQIAHALRGNRALTHLTLSQNDMTDDSAAAFASVLKTIPTLQQFHMSNTPMVTDTGVSQLATALSHCTDLRAFNLNNNKVGTNGAASINRMMKKCHRLETLKLNNCGIIKQKAAGQYIAEAIPSCPYLGHVQVSDIMGVPKYSIFDSSQGIITPDTNPNLYKIASTSPYMSGLIQTNLRRASLLCAPIEEGDGTLASTRTQDIAAIANRIPILQYMAQIKHTANLPIPGTSASSYRTAITPEKLAMVEDYLNNPPALDSKTLTYETLSTAGEDGLTPFDHPKTWKSFAEISATLTQQGAPLGKQRLSARNSRGESWLECGLASAPDIVIATLNKANIFIKPEDLLTRERNGSSKPSPLLEIAITNRLLPLLFSKENCQTASPASLRRVFNVLPDEQKNDETIKNAYDLALQRAYRYDNLNAPGRGR